MAHVPPTDTIGEHKCKPLKHTAALPGRQMQLSRTSVHAKHLGLACFRKFALELHAASLGLLELHSHPPLQLVLHHAPCLAHILAICQSAAPVHFDCFFECTSPAIQVLPGLA